MASFDNLTAVDPWMFRSSIADPWFPANDFAVETESALTKALQQSLFTQPIVAAPAWPKQSEYSIRSASASASASTVTGSGAGLGSGSGSEPETPGSKHRGGNSLLGVSIGKSKKRKSRASKRMTTYIQADPSNFRQMVQEVTGVKFEWSGRLPEPERLRRPVFNEMQGLLPTLDTSAYLVDNARRFPVSGGAMGVSKTSQVTENGGGAGVVDVYSCFSFPTLESSI